MENSILLAKDETTNQVRNLICTADGRLIVAGVSGGGGQVDNIVAGPGVDVDDTDPAAPIISVTTVFGSISSRAGDSAASFSRGGLVTYKSWDSGSGVVSTVDIISPAEWQMGNDLSGFPISGVIPEDTTVAPGDDITVIRQAVVELDLNLNADPILAADTPVYVASNGTSLFLTHDVNEGPLAVAGKVIAYISDGATNRRYSVFFDVDLISQSRLAAPFSYYKDISVTSAQSPYTIIPGSSLTVVLDGDDVTLQTPPAASSFSPVRIDKVTLIGSNRLFINAQGSDLFRSYTDTGIEITDPVVTSSINRPFILTPYPTENIWEVSLD